MKKKGEILRIRPFNMANFSGAGGYIPIFAIFGTIATFPATLVIWTNMASSVVNGDGSLNYALLRKRLIKYTLLPVSIVSLVLWIGIVMGQISSYGGNLIVAVISTVFVVAVHIGGIYVSIFYSAKLVNVISHRFTRDKWLLSTLIFAALMVVVGIVLPILLYPIAL